MAQHPRPGEDLRELPLPELLTRLSQETATLVRQELELAKAEVTRKGKRAGLGAGLVGAAGIVGFLALAALTAFFILLLNELMRAWLAALIVAAVYGGAAAGLAIRGKEKVQEATPPAPQTAETIKEDIEWAKNPTRSGSR